MREIKFRGKDTEIGKWIYGDLIHDYDNVYLRTIPVGIQQKYCYPVEVIPETVGQFTGLKDKNGKEIYEGDILCDEGFNMGIVEWDDGSWCIDWGDFKDRMDQGVCDNWDIYGNAWTNSRY